MLTKEALLAPRVREVQIDGGCITIRALTAAYAVSLRGKTLGDTEIFDMLAHSIEEPAMTAEDIGQMPLTLLQPILDAVVEFNALSTGKAEADLKKAPASSSPTS